MLSHAQDTSILRDAEINDKFPRVAALLSTELPHGSQVSDEKLWNKIAEAATGVVPEDYTINEEDQLGTVSLAVEVVLPANQVPGKKPIFAPVHVDNNYRGCELSSVLILNSTDAFPNNPDVIVREGLHDTPQQVGHVCMIEIWNFSDQPATLSVNTPVAQITRGPSFALRQDDENLEANKQLFSHINSCASDLLRATADARRAAPTTNQEELHDMMETVTDVGPISDDLRHKLHEATGEQINELLKSGEASPEQVLSAVVPLVTVANGDIGGFSRGVTAQVQPDGRRVVHFLAIDTDSYAREVHKINSNVPVTDWTHGDSVGGARELISNFVPEVLHHAVWIHSCEPAVHGYGQVLDCAGSIANHAYIAAIAASLSPVAVWSIDTSSMMRDILDTTNCFARTFNLAAAVGLPQNRERLWLSNVDVTFPKLNAPRNSMESVLNLNPKEKIFDPDNRTYDPKQPAPPLTRLGLKKGINSRRAHPLSVTELAKLQQIDDFEFPQLPAPQRIRLVTSATPPSFGEFVASAFCKSVTQADTMVAVLHRLNAIAENDDFDDMLGKAVQRFDEDTAMLRPSALVDNESQSATNIAAASSQEEGNLRSFINRTPEDLAQQLKANLVEEEKYSPDYSDTYQPSFPDLIQELSQTGIYDRDLPDKDGTIGKLESLALSMFPTWDQVFRIAGPTRMSIRASRIVNERPYSIRDPKKFEAMRRIIDDLLHKNVIARQRDSPFRSPCLLVPKKHQQVPHLINQINK